MASSSYRKTCLEEKGESCEICGSEEDIHVHHIDGDRSNNDLSNLVPLCSDHHYEIHNGEEEYSEYVDQLPDLSLNKSPSSMVRVSVKIPADSVKKLDCIAREEGLTRSDVIRDYVDAGLNEESISERELKVQKVEMEMLRERADRSEEIVDKLIESL